MNGKRAKKLRRIAKESNIAVTEKEKDATYKVLKKKWASFNKSKN